MRQIQKDTLSEIMSLRPTPQAVLDVGCGNGYFTRILASALPHAQISAIDPNASKLSTNTRQINYFQSNVEALPFASNSFDVVVSCMSFHHWNNKQNGIKEVLRVLAPKGFLVVGDPFFEGILRNRFMAWLLQATDGGKFTSFADFEIYLDVAGFEPMSVSPVSNSFGTMFVVSAQKSAAIKPCLEQ